MPRTTAEELDFTDVLELIAALATSRAGRDFVLGAEVFPSRHLAIQRWRLSRDLGAALADDGRFSFAGVDDAVPWLDPAASLPAEPEGLLALLSLARRVNAVRRRLVGVAGIGEDLADLAGGLPDLTELVRWVAPRLGRDGRVPDDASPALSRLRRQITRSRQQVISHLEGVRRSHGPATTDAPPTLRRDRYCIPVKSSARRDVPGLVLDSSGSGATAFVEPYEAVELNNQLAEGVAREREEVRRILVEIARAFADCREDLLRSVDVLARLDAVQARLAFGELIRGRLVEPSVAGRLHLVRARHPLLDERLADLRSDVFGATRRREHAAVPLDFALSEATRTLVISGPNAGGKTVVLKTVGLMVLLCYHGVPLPVDEGTTIPWFDHLWCRIGDDQDVAADLSTFSGAMQATAQLLDEAGPSSLVLYDELGNGTDPLEGAALGCALLEELNRRRCLTVTSTHLAAVAMTATSAEGMDNAAMEFDEATGRPTFTLRVGRPGRSRGLEIAAAMGIAEGIVERARELLGGQHLQLERWLQRLEQLETELLRDREDLDRQRAATAAAELDARRARERTEAERQELPQKLRREQEALRARAKKKLDRVLDELDRAQRERRHVGRRVQDRLRAEALNLEAPTEATDAAPVDRIAPGVEVRIGALGATGTVQAVRGSQVQVLVRGKKMWVADGDLSAGAPASPPATRKTVAVDVEPAVPRELMLLGLDAEEARDRVERYLDQALAAGATQVRIVHGHGTGTLRRMVQEVCRAHPAVASFGHPPGHRGGTGATEIQIAS
jgi:DNA mismatch repair protein MutS2